MAERNGVQHRTRCSTVNLRCQNPAAAASRSSSYFAALMASAVAETVVEDSADRILEEHLSRVWEETGGCEKTQAASFQLQQSSLIYSPVQQTNGGISVPDSISRPTASRRGSLLRESTNYSHFQCSSKPMDSIASFRKNESSELLAYRQTATVDQANRPNSLDDCKHWDRASSYDSPCRLGIPWNFQSMSPWSSKRNPSTKTMQYSPRDDVVSDSSTIVGYYFCDDPIPYRTTLPGKHPTLGQFKRLLNKKGNLKYFFKKASDEFDTGVVHEEVTDDDTLLPIWQGKVVGKVELKQ